MAKAAEPLSNTKVTVRDERFTGKPIDVKFQGVLRDEQAEAVRQALRYEYGLVIVDECHHVSAFSFEQIMKQVKAG